MKIQDIIEKFEEDYSSFKLCNQVSKPELDKLKQFLQDNLTLMLNDLGEEVLDHMEKIDKYAKESWEDPLTVNEAHFAYSQLKEVINIINSHR